MSRIRRLEICGIRNFGPGDADKQTQKIEFSHPLTLIFGPNGTGKTTIIECLKYATTGDLPPGAGSGSGKTNSFIHDPILTHESTVNGLVKAEIVDVKGNYVIISRRMVCTQKKFIKKFETLEAAMLRVDRVTGEKHATSLRIADANYEMGIALGVSKPILNYVIFCHQEDSTWPLEDGKKLKERFDQIFDSEKYNKALEKMRKHSKDLKNDLRVMRAERESLKIILEEALEKKKNLDKFENRLAQSIQKVSEVMERMKPLKESINQLCDTETRYIKLHTEKETKKTKYSLLKQQMIELKKNIQVLHEGTAEDLQREIATFDSILVEMESEMERLKSKLKEINREESTLKITISDKQLSIGKLKQQAQAQEKNIILRNRYLNEMIKDWELGDRIEAEVTETEAAVYLDKLNAKFSEMERTIKDMTVDHQFVESQLQKELDNFRDKKSKLESGITMLEKQIVEKRKEASKIRAQIEAAKTLASKLELIDSKLQEANGIVDTLAKSLDTDSVKKDIQDQIKERDQLELNLDKINKEVTLLQQQSSLCAELDLLQANLAAKEKDIQKLRNKHQDTLKMLLEVEVLPETELKCALNHVQERLTDQTKELNDEIQREQRELTSFETTRKHRERELQEKNMELTEIQDKIESMCRGVEYDEVLCHVQKTVKDLQDTRGMYAYKSVAYKEYIKKAETCCPLCHRNFENERELDDFKSELNDELNKNPRQLKTCEEQLKIQQKRYDDLLQLKPLVDNAKELEANTLKNLKNDLSKLKRNMSECHSRIETLHSNLIEPESKLAQCKDIIGDVALWDQYSMELTRLNQAIARVKSRLPDQVSDKSMQTAQAEQELIRKSLSVIRKKIEQLQSSFSMHNDKLQNARETRNKLVEEQLRMTSEVQKLKQLQDKLKDLSIEETSLRSSVQDLQKQLGPVQAQLEEKNNLLQMTKKDHHEMLETSRNSIGEKSKSLHNLQRVQSEIDTCIRHGVVDSLRKSEFEMKKYQDMTKELEKNKNNITTRINDIMNQISKQETRKREMNDNMTFKLKTEAAEVLQQEITTLREKLGNMNYRQLMEQKKKLSEEEDVLIREKNMAQGGHDELEHNIRELKKELNKELYRLAHKNYINKCAQITVQEEAIDNLIAYTAALDKAIIEYHEERMASVNKIILNLWELIYKGKDTTSIQIQTESTGGMGDKRRTYNYKVVQEKQKVTMDMKGRCSAGQKMLASIIIRLALAETFAKNCGVFALDEPTTNLDQANMNSLAQALSKIVNIRSKHQKNFQLIVISHDEDFISKLTKVSKIRKYYELKQNEKGLTEVEVLCIENCATEIGNFKDEESSEEDDDAESDVHSRKRKQLAEERKHIIRADLTSGPPRKKRHTKADE